MASQMPRCSFCGKSKDSVRRLIAGPGVSICDRCVELCVDVLDGGGPGPARTTRLRPSPARRLLQRLGCVFHRMFPPQVGEGQGGGTSRSINRWRSS